MTELESIIIAITVAIYSLGGFGFIYYWFIYRPNWFHKVIVWSESSGYEHSDYKKAIAYFEKRGQNNEQRRCL